MQKYYTAKMDRLLRVMTRVVWALLLLPPAGLALAYWAGKGAAPGRANPPGLDAAFPWILAAAVLLSGGIAYFTRRLAPRGFGLNDIELTIDRELRPVRIPLSAITELRKLDDGELKGLLRLMGSSGFYAHYGWFWNRKLGKFRLYACRLKDLALVRTEKDLFVLGPDSPEEFLSDVRSLLRH